MATLAGKPITNNGLGLMRMTMADFGGPDEQLFKTLKAALAVGANVWNGGDFYGTPEQNSLHLMNRYFTAYPEDAEKVVLCIKSGLVDRRTLEMDCSAAGMRKFVENALKILDGKKKIDVFGLARVDPNVPVEESVKGLEELRKEGKIGGIQLTEVSADTIRRASKIAKIDMVEAEVSLWSPEVFQNGVAETCAELSVVLVAHTPLGFGMLTGRLKDMSHFPSKSAAHLLPRFQEGNFQQNLRLVEAVEKLAKVKGCTAAQLALSWLKAMAKKPGMPAIVPIPGARMEDRVFENAKDVELTDGEMKEIDEIMKAFPVAGYRTIPHLAHFNEY